MSEASNDDESANPADNDQRPNEPSNDESAASTDNDQRPRGVATDERFNPAPNNYSGMAPGLHDEAQAETEATTPAAPAGSGSGNDAVLNSSGDVDRGPNRDHSGGLEQMKDKWVINLTDEPLSDAEKKVLSKGLNFVPTPKTVNNVEFITEVEKMLSKSDLTQDDVNKVRFEVTKALQSFRPDSDNLTAERATRLA